MLIRSQTFLTHDLVLHHADEEEDLFPLVRLRALPEDDLGAFSRISAKIITAARQWLRISPVH